MCSLMQKVVTNSGTNATASDANQGVRKSEIECGAATDGDKVEYSSEVTFATGLHRDATGAWLPVKPNDKVEDHEECASEQPTCHLGCFAPLTEVVMCYLS